MLCLGTLLRTRPVASGATANSPPLSCYVVHLPWGELIPPHGSSGTVQGFRGCEPQQTSTSERVKYSKFKHETQQTPASGDTNSRKGLQVAGIQVFFEAPSGSGESWFEPRRGDAEGGSPRRFFMGIGLPGSPLLPSHPATGKDVDFVHPRSMSW
jgi:hypothetical protein